MCNINKIISLKKQKITKPTYFYKIYVSMTFGNEGVINCGVKNGMYYYGYIVNVLSFLAVMFII